jgi:hypothetical protein
VTTASSFVPTASAYLPATATPATIVLPTTGTPTVALVTNIGPLPVFPALGTTVPPPTGIALMPGASITLSITGATNIAAATLSGASGINIAVGT